MALISIEGMRFRAFHGLYPEEQVLGTDFLLDVWIDTDISKASVVVEDGTPKLDNSVNYQTIYDLCEIEMRQTEKLLETVVNNIIFRFKYQFPHERSAFARPKTQSARWRSRRMGVSFGG